MKYCSLKGLMLLVMTVAPASADVLTATQRFLGVGGQFPGYEETGASELDEAAYSPADLDLGVQEILVERTGRAALLWESSMSVYRTDRAPSGNALTDVAAWFYVSRSSLSWRPHLHDGWFGDIGVAQDFFRFDTNAAMDHENFGFRLGTFKTLPDLDDLVVFMRYEYQRLTTGSFGTGDYHAQRVRAGLQKVLFAVPGHQVMGGVSGAYEWTAKPAFLERNELSFDVVYRVAITDVIHTALTWRSTYYDFASFGREDWTHGMGLEIIWQATPNLRGQASVFYDKNDSNSALGVNDYEAWTAGVGVGFRFVF